MFTNKYMTTEIQDKFERVCDLRKQALRDRRKQLGNMEYVKPHIDLNPYP